MFGISLLPDQLEHWNFQEWVHMVQGPCLESVYLWGPCQDHVRTMFGLTLLLDQLEQWNFHPWDIMVKSLCLWSVYFVDPVRTPCWDHVLPSLASSHARALKFSRLSQNGLRPMSIDHLFLGPCQGPDGTMYGLALLTDQREHWNFQG